MPLTKRMNVHLKLFFIHPLNFSRNNLMNRVLILTKGLKISNCLVSQKCEPLLTKLSNSPTHTPPFSMALDLSLNPQWRLREGKEADKRLSRNRLFLDAFPRKRKFPCLLDSRFKDHPTREERLEKIESGPGTVIYAKHPLFRRYTTARQRARIPQGARYQPRKRKIYIWVCVCVHG